MHKWRLGDDDLMEVEMAWEANFIQGRGHPRAVADAATDKALRGVIEWLRYRHWDADMAADELAAMLEGRKES